MSLRLNIPLPDECHHTLTREGPRVNARWGSWPTEICMKCNAWRTTGYVNSLWHEAAELTELLQKNSDEE